MDARTEPRSSPAASAEVAVLGEGQPCMAGTILDVSAHGMALLLASPLPDGSAIKIESGDTLVLGEVSHCTHSDGAYRVGVVVKHRLEGLAELHRLNRMLHGATQTETVPSPIMKG